MRYLTLALLLVATPAAAQYVPRGQMLPMQRLTPPSQMAPMPEIPAPPVLQFPDIRPLQPLYGPQTCSTTCTPYGGYGSQCRTTCN